MNDEPNLAFNIDALFDHMVNNMDHDMEDELDWVFSLRSEDVSKMERVAEQLDDEFLTLIEGDEPSLSVIHRGALTPTEVKEIVSRLSGVAEQAGLAYEGVGCYEVMDDDELFGWLDVDNATWRLRHFTDSGLPANADLPWVFLVLSEEKESLHNLAEALEQAGHEGVNIYDEPDDDGMFGLCLFMPGKNNEVDLTKKYVEIGEVAKQHGSHMGGIQFFSEDDFHDGGDDGDADGEIE